MSENIREKEKNNWEKNNNQETRIKPEENKGVELKIEGARRKQNEEFKEKEEGRREGQSGGEGAGTQTSS